MSVTLANVAALTSARRANRVAALALTLLVLLLVLTRLATYNEPLERDITAFAVIGRELLEGRALYSDLWDHKPPAGMVTHAVATALLGYGRHTVFVINLAAAVITLLAVYAAGRAIGGTASGLWAAAFWTAISGDLYVQGNQPNLEVFMNAALAWAFALLIRDPWPAALARTSLVGALFSLASLYKTVALAPAITLTIAAAAWTPRGFRFPRRPGFLTAALIGVVGATAWLLVLLYFSLTGRLTDFTDAVFRYNHFYAGDIGRNLARLFDATIYLSLQSMTPLICFSALGAAIGLATGDRRRWLFLAAWAIGTAAAVALPGRFFPHYFQLWLPLLAVGGGWAVAELSRVVPRKAPSLGHILGATVLVLLAIFQAPFYEFSPDDWSRAKYRSDLFVAERALARQLSTWLAKDETFYEFGAEPALYFETGRRPLSGVFYVYPLLSGPLRDKLSARLIRDLDQAPPDLFIIPDWVLFATRNGHPVLDWLALRYAAVPRDPGLGPFVLFCRRGSPIESRLPVKRLSAPGARINERSASTSRAPLVAPPVGSPTHRASVFPE